MAGRAGGRERIPGTERRRAIVEAARSEFGRSGYDGTSTAAIAHAAGCAESILYRHFPSKLAILRAVLAEAPAGVLRIGPGAPPARLAGVVSRVLADPEAGRSLRVLVSAIAVAHRDPEVADAIVEAFASVRAMLVDVVHEAQSNGTVDRALDPEDVAWLWQGLMLGGLLRDSVRADGTADGAAAAAETLDALLRPGRAAD